MWYVHMLFSSHNLMTHAHTQSDHLLRRSRIRRGKVSKRLQTTTPSLPPSPPRSFDILSLSMRKRARKGSCKHFGREGIPAHTHASRHCVETHPATPRNPQFSSRCLAPACERPPLPMSNRVSPAGPKDPAAQGVPLHPHAPASGSDIDDALSSEGACANGHPSHGHKGTHVHNAVQQRTAPHTTHSCRAIAVAYPSSCCRQRQQLLSTKESTRCFLRETEAVAQCVQGWNKVSKESHSRIPFNASINRID